MSTSGETTFNLVVSDADTCRADLITQLEAAINSDDPVTNEVLLAILVSLIECTNASAATGESDGVVTGITIIGDVVTLTRSNGLDPVIGTVNISANSTIVTINGTVTAIDNRLITAEGELDALDILVATLLDTVATGDSIEGDGTVGDPLEVFISADADNIAILSVTDGGVYVPAPSVSALTVVVYLADDTARLAVGSPLEETIYTVLDSANDASNVRESWTYNGSIWVRLDTAVVSAGGANVAYTSGNLLVKADGVGITYGLVGNLATITIPNGVFPSRLRINESYASIGNSETFLIKIIDNNPNINQDLSTFDPYNLQVIERDNFAGDNLPDGAGNNYQYEAGSLALGSRSTLKVTDIQEVSNTIIYEIGSLGVGTKWSILLV